MIRALLSELRDDLEFFVRLLTYAVAAGFIGGAFVFVFRAVSGL